MCRITEKVNWIIPHEVFRGIDGICISDQSGSHIFTALLAVMFEIVEFSLKRDCGCLMSFSHGCSYDEYEK